MTRVNRTRKTRKLLETSHLMVPHPARVAKRASLLWQATTWKKKTFFSKELFEKTDGFKC